MSAARSQSSRILLLLTCVLVILARTSGAHLHLCFDGREPPASIHLTEDGDPDLHHPGASGTQNDTDVSLVGNALLKKAGVAPDLLPMLVASVVLFGAALQAHSPPTPWYYDTPAPSSPFQLRPPLRGPPG